MDNSLTPWQPLEFEPSMLSRVQKAAFKCQTEHGYAPTKIFMSLDYVVELLIEVLPGARSVTINKNAKNEILGMTIYRVVETGVLIAC